MRSVAAVLAGFVTLSVALNSVRSIGTAVLMRMYPDLPATTTIVNYNMGARILWLVWGTIAMVAAGFVTARLASTSHVTHAVVMGAIQAAVTLSVMLSAPTGEPTWFWLTGIALMIPAAWLGGVLSSTRSS